MSLNKKYKHQLIDIIKNKLPKCKIYLFGSYATGKEIWGSDIDIAILDSKKIPYEMILKILIDIENTNIPMKVDLVDLQTVSDDFKENVIREGIEWIN